MQWPAPVGPRRRRGNGSAGQICLSEGCMEGSDLTRSAKRHEAGDDVVHLMGMAVDKGTGRFELEALEAELAYRGPERRNGPGAGLAKRLAAVLDEVDYGLVLMAADGHVVHANHAARVELAASKTLQLNAKRLVGRSTVDQRALDDALAGARDRGQ